LRWDLGVRVAATLLLIGLTGAPAAACPGVCLAMIETPAHVEVPARHVQKPLRLTVRALPEDDTLPSVRFGDQHRVEPREDTPWIWKALREKVYAQMPQHEAGGVSLVMSPVVIAGVFDTVPGFGVAGGF
jgi:hypothetical protein